MPGQDTQFYGSTPGKVFLLEIHRSLKKTYGLVLGQLEASDKFERIGFYSREEKWYQVKYGSCTRQTTSGGTVRIIAATGIGTSA